MTVKNKDNRLLAIDVGAGTQDILVYDERVDPENRVKMVMPSRTTILARQIALATAQGKPIFMTGRLMGGGPIAGAIRRHLKAGFAVYSTPEAAKTINDDLERVTAMGITLCESAPEEAETIQTGDLNLDAIRRSLRAFDVTMPKLVAVAAQDHGECAGVSNRKFRFDNWRKAIEEGGEIASLAYGDKIPSHLTRLRAIREIVPGCLIMDSGPAAVWGALEDELVFRLTGEPMLVINIGNLHTLGAIVHETRLLGIFEHHTSMMTTAKLDLFVRKFSKGKLANEEVFNDKGHGAFLLPEAANLGPPQFVAVTGPHRALARPLGYLDAAPHGDMMLTGCYGLVRAARAVGFLV